METAVVSESRSDSIGEGMTETVLFSSLSSRASVSIIIVIDSPILRMIKKNSLFQFREETFDNIAN